MSLKTTMKKRMMGKKSVNYDDRKCFVNLSHKTYIIPSTGKPHWLLFENQWVCKSCYGKLIQTPNIDPQKRKYYNDKRTKEQIQEDNQRRFLFKNKISRAKEKPRKGVCEWCDKNIGDTYINHLGKIDIIEKTHLHHIRYNYNDKLKDTVELCHSCHMIETNRLRNIQRKIIYFINNFIPIQ